MTEARWMNPSQPQTLQVAVFLLYAEAAFTLLDVFRIGVGPLLETVPWGWAILAVIPAAVVGGRGIASERKIGYMLGLAVAFAPFIIRIGLYGSVEGALEQRLISLLFEVALVILLLHPQSRDYQRVWFK